MSRKFEGLTITYRNNIILHMDKESPELSQNLKQIYQKAMYAFNKANYEYAINLFLRLLTIKPDHADARHYLRLSRLKLVEQNPPSFIKNFFSKMLEGFYLLKAFVYQLKKDPIKTLHEYEKAVNLSPKNIKCLIKIGNTLASEDMISSAMKTFEDILIIDSNNLEALRQLGNFYMKSGNYDIARKCIEKALRLNPSDFASQKSLNDLDALTLLEKDFGV